MLFFLTAAVFGVMLRGKEQLQQIPDLLDAFTADAVMHPFSVPPGGDDAGIAEDLHMMGQSGLGD